MCVDGTEKMPIEQSCRCRLIGVEAELDDLWRAGRLPPFNS